MPDPVIARCPACARPVGVPEEFLGKVVHCLQCRATFTAPARTETGLTAPTLVRRGPRTVAPMLFAPMFGLLLLGGAGLAVNLYLYVAFGRDPEVAKAYARTVVRQLAADRRPDADPKADKAAEAEKNQAFEAKLDADVEKAVAAWAPTLQKSQLPFVFISAGVLAGGVAFALRRGYPMAFLGCLLAVLNVNHACCVLGAVIGIWGFFALISEDGRRHFGKIPP